MGGEVGREPRAHSSAISPVTANTQVGDSRAGTAC